MFTKVALVSIVVLFAIALAVSLQLRAEAQTPPTKPHWQEYRYREFYCRTPRALG